MRETNILTAAVNRVKTSVSSACEIRSVSDPVLIRITTSPLCHYSTTKVGVKCLISVGRRSRLAIPLGAATLQSECFRVRFDVVTSLRNYLVVKFSSSKDSPDLL